MNQSALQSYQVQQVMTASPAKLVAMLCDKAVACLGEAGAAIARGDVEARHNANRKAIDIIAHLWGTLDLDQGGEVAANLNSLYDFMMRRLGDVDMKNDRAAATEVIGLLDPLRKAWHQLAATQVSGQTAPAESLAISRDPASPGTVTISA